MFVCICHAIREHDVHIAVEDGETTLHGVYSRLGCKPRCGSCLGTMASTVADCLEGENEGAAD